MTQFESSFDCPTYRITFDFDMIQPGSTSFGTFGAGPGFIHTRVWFPLIILCTWFDLLVLFQALIVLNAIKKEKKITQILNCDAWGEHAIWSLHILAMHAWIFSNLLARSKIRLYR